MKSTSDLLLITSDLYALQHGRLIANPNRMFGADVPPIVKLGDTFKKVSEFQRQFKPIPNMVDLDHLTVSGDVKFGCKTKLAGTMIIVATSGNAIDIPDGSVLENKLISGTLSIIDH